MSSKAAKMVHETIEVRTFDEDRAIRVIERQPAASEFSSPSSIPDRASPAAADRVIHLSSVSRGSCRACRDGLT